MKKLPEPVVIRANVRLMRRDFEFPQGFEQWADIHAT
jgi:hypothetical protein